MSSGNGGREFTTAKWVALGVILSMMGVLVVGVTIGPIVDDDYEISVGLGVVMFTTLVGALLALFGIRTIIHRNGNGK